MSEPEPTKIDLKALPENIRLAGARNDLLGAIESVGKAYDLDAQKMALVVEACMGNVNTTLLSLAAAQYVSATQDA